MSHEERLSEKPVGLDDPVRLLRQTNHDLRNPLNALLATANMLMEGIYDPLTAKQARAVQRMERNLQRVLVFMDDLSGYVKAQAGEYELAIHEFDPLALLEAIRAECQPNAEQRNIALSIQADCAVPHMVFTDQKVLKRILLALVWNAISFTQQGSVQIVSEWTDGWTVSVTDTGIGIPSKAIPFLFELFWRGETLGAQVPTSSSGIGLALAKAFAQLLGGTVALKETSNSGSTFVLHLPNIKVTTVDSA